MAATPRRVRYTGLVGSVAYHSVMEFNKLVNWMEQHVHPTAMTNPPLVLTSAFGVNRIVGPDGKLPNNLAPSAGNIVRVNGLGLPGSFEYEWPIHWSAALAFMDAHTHPAINSNPTQAMPGTTWMPADVNGREPGTGVIVTTFYANGGSKNFAVINDQSPGNEMTDIQAIFKEFNDLVIAYATHQHAAIGGVAGAGPFSLTSRLADYIGRDYLGATVL